MAEQQKTDPREFGKSFKQFVQFVMECKAGKRIMLQGPEYVSLDIHSYNELVARGNSQAVLYCPCPCHTDHKMNVKECARGCGITHSAKTGELYA
jgi:hypothetical protein